MLYLIDVIPTQPPPVDNRDDVAKWLRSQFNIEISLKEDCTWYELLEWLNSLYSITVGAAAYDTAIIDYRRPRVHLAISDAPVCNTYTCGQVSEGDEVHVRLRRVTMRVDASDEYKLERRR